MQGLNPKLRTGSYVSGPHEPRGDFPRPVLAERRGRSYLPVKMATGCQTTQEEIPSDSSGALPAPAAWAAAVLALAAGLAPAGPKAAPSVRDLVRQLDSPHAGARIAAAEALSELRPRARSAVPALLRAVRKPPRRAPGMGSGRSDALAAARALWTIQPQAALNVLQGDRRQANLNVIAAAGRLGGPAVVQGLNLAMLDHCDDVRLAAVSALGQLASTPGQSLPDAAVRRLVRATEDSSARVRRSAVRAIGRLGGARGESALAETLRGGSYRDARVEAMRVLAGRRGASARRALRSVGGDKDARIAVEAKALLDRGAIGGVINAKTLAGAKNLRPLSTIQIGVPAPRATSPAGKRPFEPAGGGPKISRATIRQAMAQVSAMPGPVGEAAQSMRPEDVEKLLADPSVMELARKMAGGKGGSTGTSPPGDWQKMLRAAMQGKAPAPPAPRGQSK